MHDVGTFDRFARVYDWVMPAADKAVLTSGLEQATRSLDRVIDLGGGTGRAGSALADAVVVVDPAWGMTQRARAHGQEAVQGLAEYLPLIADGCDAVLIVDAFHHFRDHERSLESVFAAIRPGGVVVIREFDPQTVRGCLVAWLERVFGFDSQFFSPESMATMLQEAGFEATIVDQGFGYTVTGTVPDAQVRGGVR